MNKITAIETFSKHFNELVDRSKWIYEAMNGQMDSINIANYEKEEQKLSDKMESMCVLLGIEIDWPGLYPSFKVNGYSCHTIEDALAMKEGFPSIGAMKHELGVTNVSN